MILLVVFAPLVMGLLCLLMRRELCRLPIATYLLTAGVALYVLLLDATMELHLVDSFGISLLLDSTGAWFLLLNALVSIAVAWYEHARGRHHYFFVLLAMLHGCMNACFVSTDLFNLYVVIELTTIIAFLLVGQGMTTRHLWNALRYLFLSNVGMLFFLLGTLLVYESAGDFALVSVVKAPPTARALIVTGLLVKGGIFLPGLWLPQAHAEAESAVSALLSGVVVSIGLLPLIRLATYAAELESILRLLGFGGVFAGLAVAFFQRDIKRLLACSTVSQLGFVLISPMYGAVYAFAHGLAKAALFLCAGCLPDRDLIRVRKQPVDRPVAWVMALAALSIAGAPLLMGFHAKYLVAASLSGWSAVLTATASVGTAALLTPIILIPLRSGKQAISSAWAAPALLCAVLLAGVFAGPYSVSAWIKSIGIILAGILLHVAALKRLMTVPLPSGWEKLEHVVGMTCMALIIIIIGVYLP